ncbi:hypothetical protein [Pantoea stewartii]|uniref:hypothetical protein n=1 Tax=Pantoea stewartii TaxID=66269 RepID=UPI001FD2C48B|nr:hypothetical protein [Pantoea stewartii]
MENNKLSDVNSKSGSELIAIAHGIAANFESPATELLRELASRLECSIIRGNELQQKLDAMAAESDTNLRSAASELNTSWMLHKTMMGAQAALLCLSQGDILSAKEWLEGTTDEAIIDMPDNLNPGDLQAWFDSHMVSNGGTNGFLTHNEALELLRKRAPATVAYLNSVRAEAVNHAGKMIMATMNHQDKGVERALECIAEIEMQYYLRSGTHDTADKAG